MILSLKTLTYKLSHRKSQSHMLNTPLWNVECINIRQRELFGFQT